MKRTLNKLKSNTGASIILALMFMLICVFIGGSVLVAATVNGGRLSGERAEKQAELSQRSIASVFVKMLADEDRKFDLRYDFGSTDIDDPLKKAIYTSAKAVYNNEETKKIPFSVSVVGSDNSTLTEVGCYAICDESYKVKICFADDPKVELVLSGRKSGDTVQWYNCKIVKAVRVNEKTA